MPLDGFFPRQISSNANPLPSFPIHSKVPGMRKLYVPENRPPRTSEREASAKHPIGPCDSTEWVSLGSTTLGLLRGTVSDTGPKSKETAPSLVESVTQGPGQRQCG